MGEQDRTQDALPNRLRSHVAEKEAALGFAFGEGFLGRLSGLQG